jgi:hypothetical protein
MAANFLFEETPTAEIRCGKNFARGELTVVDVAETEMRTKVGGAFAISAFAIFFSSSVNNPSGER